MNCVGSGFVEQVAQPVELDWIGLPDSAAGPIVLDYNEALGHGNQSRQELCLFLDEVKRVRHEDAITRRQPEAETVELGNGRTNRDAVVTFRDLA
jgi:hypothetical protein